MYGVGLVRIDNFSVRWGKKPDFRRCVKFEGEKKGNGAARWDGEKTFRGKKRARAMRGSWPVI